MNKSSTLCHSRWSFYMLTASCTQGSPSRCEEKYFNGEEKSGFQESVLVRTTSKDINVCDLRHNRLSSRRSFPVAVINGGLKRQVEVPPRYFDDTGHCRMISHIDFTSPLSPFFFFLSLEIDEDFTLLGVFFASCIWRQEYAI